MSGSISVDLSAVTSSGSTPQGGSSSQSRIAALRKQLSSLTEELASISKDDTLSAKQKGEKAKLIQAQMQLIQAQISQLEAEEAKKAEKSASKNGTVSTSEPLTPMQSASSASKEEVRGLVDIYA